MVLFDDVLTKASVHVRFVQPRFNCTISLGGQWETISQVNEQDDHLEIDGQVFMKPFVEKPVSAENHDVYIYFPSSAGGGSQRLFRKVRT